MNTIVGKEVEKLKNSIIRRIENEVRKEIKQQIKQELDGKHKLPDKYLTLLEQISKDLSSIAKLLNSEFCSLGSIRYEIATYLFSVSKDLKELTQ